MTRAFRAAGLAGHQPPTMRHTGVTDMLEDGVSPVAIRSMRLDALRMLERYGHLRDAELPRATGTAARTRGRWRRDRDRARRGRLARRQRRRRGRPDGTPTDVQTRWNR